MHNTFSKWFLIGLGIRAALALVISVFVVWNFETAMVYFADLPTLLFLTLAEEALPGSWFKMLVGKHPFYIPMNVAACLLWGGLFMLIPLTRKLLFLVRGRNRSARL